MTVTQTVGGRRPRMRVLAVAAAGALAFAGLGVVNAASADAATLTATGGSLQWGLKESLLNYHIRHMGSSQTAEPSGGVTASPATRTAGALGTSPAQQYPLYWNWPFVGGSYDSVTNSYTAQYGGSVTLIDSNGAPSTGPTGPSPFKNFVFSNPKVVIDLDNGSKSLIVDIDPGDDGDPSTPLSAATLAAELGSFDNLTAEVAASGGTVAYSDLATALTEDGAAAFNGFYGAGDPLDPVTTSLTGLEDEGPPPGGGDNEQSISVTIPDGCESPVTGDVVWSITDDGAVSLPEATDQGTFLQSVGAIDPIQVTDTRDSDCANTVIEPWTISGQVSDFTGTAGTLPGELLGWTPNTLAAWITAGDAVVSGFGTDPLGPGLSISQLLATINGGTPGTDTVGAGLDLRLPIDTAAGSYQAILTLTGLS